MLGLKQGEDGIKNIEKHARSPACIDHLPDRLHTAAVMVDLDMAELTEKKLKRIPGEAAVVLGVGMIAVEETCGGDAHSTWLQDMENSIDRPLRIVQVFENLDGNDRIE